MKIFGKDIRLIRRTYLFEETDALLVCQELQERMIDMAGSDFMAECIQKHVDRLMQLEQYTLDTKVSLEFKMEFTVADLVQIVERNRRGIGAWITPEELRGVSP